MKVKGKYSLVHGDRDSLKRLHLLCQHSSFYIINAFQSPIVSSIPNQLNTMLPRTVLTSKRKKKMKIENPGRQETEKAKRNRKSCSLWKIEEAFRKLGNEPNLKLLRLVHLLFYSLNVCWYLFTIDSIFSQENWLQKDQRLRRFVSAIGKQKGRLLRAKKRRIAFQGQRF